MPLKLLNRARKKLGVRLTLWYSTIFILSSVILFIVSYVFLSTSLEDHREAVQSKLREYLSLAKKAEFPPSKGHSRMIKTAIRAPTSSSAYLIERQGRIRE